MRLNCNHFTFVRNAFSRIAHSAKLVDESSSFNSLIGISTFRVSPSRCYSSYPIARSNGASSVFENSRKRTLLVIGKSAFETNSKRTMSLSGVNQRLERAFDNIAKSNQDGREYRGLLLDNGLKCLLISDPSTDRSAAAVDVHAGYLLDPNEFPGLAHFCEHMLFMGSRKYPQENLFMKFIEDHAGHTNAYTSSENTNYHFEVSTGKFKEALDIFAQFFISPLFDAGSTDREINAVDSENQKNLKSDAWRMNQLENSIARPDHPFSKFGTGNLSTLKTEPEKLGLSVREELLKFHSKYYSSNLMSLVLLGKESLDELQQYAVEMFSDIPNKNLAKIDFDPNPYAPDTSATIKYVNPVQDIRQLSIAWTIPDLRDKYPSSPSQYISHLIGHEGEGSLLSELKRRGWCNSLYAGSRREVRGFQFFHLTVDLSEEGGENLEGVIKCVYEYLNMIQKSGPVQWVFDEYTNLGKVNFTFKDKENPIQYVSSLASDLHIYDMKDILTANYFPQRFEPNEISALFPYLKPDKMRVSAISKKYEGKTDKTEKWYGTEYRMEHLSPQFISEISSPDLQNPAFNIPPPNEFIPTDLDLIKHDVPLDQLPKHPQVVLSTPISRLWYKEDVKFLLPKAVIKLELRNPLVYFSPVNVNMTAMFVDLLLDSITELLYSAELAGLKYNVSSSSYGLNIGVSGFNDKIDRLLETLIDKMVTFKVNPERFNILKERVSV